MTTLANNTSNWAATRGFDYQMPKSSSAVTQSLWLESDELLTERTESLRLQRSLPSNEELRRIAANHRPPAEWYERDEERPF